MNLLIFGPPGSGKGTQAELLVEKYNYFLIDIGSILRSFAEKPGELASEIRDNQRQGKLNSDILVNNIISEHLNENNKWERLLFDGYPRTVQQWNALNNLLVANNTKIDAAIYLELSEHICISRIETRVLSRKSGKIFNKVSVPPPHNWPNEDLYSRNDGTPEALHIRFNQFYELTTALIAEFEKLNILVKINANNSIKEIHQEIITKIGEGKLIS